MATSLLDSLRRANRTKNSFRTGEHVQARCQTCRSDPISPICDVLVAKNAQNLICCYPASGKFWRFFPQFAFKLTYRKNGASYPISVFMEHIGEKHLWHQFLCSITIASLRAFTDGETLRHEPDGKIILLLTRVPENQPIRSLGVNSA